MKFQILPGIRAAFMEISGSREQKQVLPEPQISHSSILFGFHAYKIMENPRIIVVTGKLQPPRVMQCGFDQLRRGDLNFTKCSFPGFAVEFLRFLAITLNFEIHFLPVRTWTELLSLISNGTANMSLNFMTLDQSNFRWRRNLAPQNYFSSGFVIKIIPGEQILELQPFPPAVPFSMAVWLVLFGEIAAVGLVSMLINCCQRFSGSFFTSFQMLMPQSSDHLTFSSTPLVVCIIFAATMLSHAYQSMILSAMLSISTSNAFTGTKTLAPLIKNRERRIFRDNDKGNYLRLIDSTDSDIGGPFRAMKSALLVNPPLIKNVPNFNSNPRLENPEFVLPVSRSYFTTAFKTCDYLFIPDKDLNEFWESPTVHRNFSFYSELNKKATELFPFMANIIQRQYMRRPTCARPSMFHARASMRFGTLKSTFILWFAGCLLCFIALICEIMTTVPSLASDSFWSVQILKFFAARLPITTTE